MKRKVKVIFTAAIFTFCTAIGGCKAVESKLELFMKLFCRRILYKKKKVCRQAKIRKCQRKKICLKKSRHLLRIRKRKRLVLQLSRLGTVTVEEAKQQRWADSPGGR